MARYKAEEQRLIHRIHTDPNEALSLMSSPEGKRDPRNIPHPDDLGIETPQFGNWEEHVVEA
jgi:hypothetical protein